MARAWTEGWKLFRVLFLFILLNLFSLKFSVWIVVSLIETGSTWCLVDNLNLIFALFHLQPFWLWTLALTWALLNCSSKNDWVSDAFILLSQLCQSCRLEGHHFAEGVVNGLRVLCQSFLVCRQGTNSMRVPLCWLFLPKMKIVHSAKHRCRRIIIIVFVEIWTVLWILTQIEESVIWYRWLKVQRGITYHYLRTVNIKVSRYGIVFLLGLDFIYSFVL
jgi:hypothetical protein